MPGHRSCEGGRWQRRKRRRGDGGEGEEGGGSRRGAIGNWGRRGRSECSSERVTGWGTPWMMAGMCGQGGPVEPEREDVYHTYIFNTQTHTCTVYVQHKYTVHGEFYQPVAYSYITHHLYTLIPYCFKGYTALSPHPLSLPLPLPLPSCLNTHWSSVPG